MADEPTTSPPGSGQAQGEAPLAPGQVLAGHEVQFEAGRGGMGVVYAALHLRLQVRRALKVLTAKAAADAVFRARFERECQLAAALEHPNIMPVYEAGESNGMLYLSMRYVDGQNLSQVVAASGPLHVRRVTELVLQLAAALDAAHKRGLVHRDVKPANVLLEGSGDQERAFLGDFGISRLLTGASALTETGDMLGTVNYVAPEQIAGTSVDARADVYSLACVAYEALTGAAPFEQDTQLATMFAHANAPRAAPSAARRELPGAVDRVFARALAVNPDSRYAQASGFANELGRALAGEQVAAGVERKPAARRRRGSFAAAVALALVIAGAALTLAGVFSGSDRPASDGTPRGSADQRALPAPPARAVGTVRVARDPVAITVGELNVWTASASGQAISAIVPATNDLARQPILIEGMPVSVVAGFGSIWVVDRAADSLLRLDPGQGAVPVRVAVGARPSDVAVSANNLWVTNRGDDTVSRVDPATNRVDATIDVGDAPRSIAAGEGGIWVANSGSGTLTELDPVSVQLRGRPVRVGGTPTALAAGEAGVWIVDSIDDRLLRVSPGSRDVSPEIIAGSSPTSVATGYGYAWVAFANGHVRRIDPTQLEPAGDRIPVGAKPSAIAAGKGFVWTANSGDGTVTRIQPRPTGVG